MKTKILYFAATIVLLAFATSGLTAAQPKVGEKARDFTLKTLEEKDVKLSELTAKEKVVLIVLRGWPGYQCPLCTKQVRDFTASAEGFAQAKVRVVMVYPGPSDKLKAHAQEFLGNAEWPKDFIFVTDPDYTMVSAYGLRWDAKAETAYPSTFVIDRKGVVRFANVSKGHGDRSQADGVLEAVKAVAD